MSIQHSDYLAMLARMKRQTLGNTEVAEACEDESELHADILAECRRRGWLALHGSMAHRARRTAGEPDFVILYSQRVNMIGDGARVEPKVLIIECKTRAGKLSPAQLGLHAHARKLGHEVHIVRSFAEFISIL